MGCIYMNNYFDEQLYRDMNISNYASTEYLHINTSGINRYSYVGKNLAVRIHRPSGRLDYHFLFMVKGTKRAVVNGRAYDLMPGDCVFYMPGDPQDYTFFATADSPVCESFYIHFSGTAATEILRTAHFTESCVIPARTGETKRIFISLITAAQTGSHMTACGQLLRLIPLLSPGFSEHRSEGMQRIREQVEYIKTHFAEDIDIDKCADECGLSRSRFAHLFSDIMGMPPYKYQLKLRLDVAKELIMHSALTVSEISASVGFSDPLYFSRIFRKYYEMSPSEYRNQSK